MENAHDKWIDLLFEEHAKCSKEKAVNGFLSSFGTGNSGMRSGLPVFAIMQTFPGHKFQSPENDEFSPCHICSSPYGHPATITDWEFISDCFNAGGLVGHSADNYYAYLKLFNEIENIPVPDAGSIQIFSEILDIILSARPEENLKKRIAKQIGKSCKSNFKDGEEVQLMLETLGYCSILETDRHKGLLEKFTNLAAAPRKTHSSDWNYPVDFWLGKDGINTTAFQFWFGNFKELERYWQ
jgi:hypothetical protein